MLSYVIRRFIYMVSLVAVMSVIAFAIIELPPGDYLSSYIEQLENQGTPVDRAEIVALRRQFGLDIPVYARYFTWVGGMLRGNFGRSLYYNKPIIELIAERLPWTVVISVLTLVFTYATAIPIGIYSALRQYSARDHVITGFGFLGLATPNFLLALVLMFIVFKYFGFNPSGLFSPGYRTAAWSLSRFVDLLKHLPIPIIVIGTAGTAGLIRIMRGCLLDEIRKQYVITARAKGVAERTLLFKYPVRMAINPLVSTIGWQLPAIVSGATITAIVLNLPTIGKLLYQALIGQDTYLAGTLVLLLCSLTVIGTLISDVLLVVVDPRIRYQRSE